MRRLSKVLFLIAIICTIICLPLPGDAGTVGALTPLTPDETAAKSHLSRLLLTQ